MDVRLSVSAALLLMAWLSPVAGADASDEAGSTTVRLVKSPFVHGETALLVETPPDGHYRLSWSSDEVTPGTPYSLSLFYQQAEFHAGVQPTISIDVYDGRAQSFHQTLYPRPEPFFYAESMVFNTSQVRVVVTVPRNAKVIIGQVGMEVPASRLAVPGYAATVYLWPHSVRLPKLYRGLRRFEVRTYWHRSPYGKEETLPVEIERIIARGTMHISTARLPRLLPGRNTLELRHDASGPGASVKVDIHPRQQPKIATCRVAADSSIPADGATFGRVYVTPVDAAGDAISGALVRLRCPHEVRCFPYVWAVSDWDKLQRTWEFQVLSTTPGTYELPVEIWTGRDWTDAGVAAKVVFVPAKPYPKFRRLAYVRPWVEPRAVEGTNAAPTTALSIALDPDERARSVPVNIDSMLMPRCAWRVTGPVANLGLFSDIQPDSRSLATLGASIRAAILDAGGDMEDVALAIEEYVNLGMEGYLWENYDGRNYPTPARVLREGRGWCGAYARSVYGIALEAGLEATVDNTANHVLGEVRAENLRPIVLDALLQVSICTPDGARTALSGIEAPDKTLLGLGVNNRTRRSHFWQDFLQRIANDQTKWQRKPESGVHPSLIDQRITAIDLRPWEQLSWVGGHVVSADQLLSDGTMAMHQTVVTQTAEVIVEKHRSLPGIEYSGRAEAQGGGGTLVFPFDAPAELHDLIVTTDGVLGDNGELTLDIAPLLDRPLIAGGEKFDGWPAE